jgi:hypothetical protein
MVPHKNSLGSGTWIVNEVEGVVSGKVTWNGSMSEQEGVGAETKKSGLKAVTLIAAPNPVSQVLW